MAPVYKSDRDDEDKELDFELDYLMSLTTKERFEMMFKKSELIKKQLLAHGHRRPFEVIKRT